MMIHAIDWAAQIEAGTGAAMTTYAYVDNSNLYIEGCRVAAVRNGMAKNVHDAQRGLILDHAWQIDYGKLYQLLCAHETVARLWGSPPPGDSFWQMVERKGFTPAVYEKNAGGKEKKVDVAIAHRMTKDAYPIVDRKNDRVLLVAGDSDYLPVVSDLVTDGFEVDVAFWDDAARELREAASKFISLNHHHARLSAHAHHAGVARVPAAKG
jgi:uncharacterized LabA/DUF88 family protein